VQDKNAEFPQRLSLQLIPILIAALIICLALANCMLMAQRVALLLYPEMAPVELRQDNFNVLLLAQ
jgi:hypothetical protein